MAAVTSDVESHPMKTPSSIVARVNKNSENHEEYNSKSNSDEAELAHFGKRQQLKVSHWGTAARCAVRMAIVTYFGMDCSEALDLSLSPVLRAH